MAACCDLLEAGKTETGSWHKIRLVLDNRVYTQATVWQSWIVAHDGRHQLVPLPLVWRHQQGIEIPEEFKFVHDCINNGSESGYGIVSGHCTTNARCSQLSCLLVVMW